MRKQPHKHKNKYKRKTKNFEQTVPPQNQPVDNPANSEDCVQQGVAGQHFHIDFEFMRGSTYNVKQEKDPLSRV